MGLTFLKLDPAVIRAAYLGACQDELRALKPGNVHDFADGHRMTVADFECSADVSAGPLARRGASVGARILGAVEATLASVGSNTNLGITLLCAPLALAAESGMPLEDVLAGLTIEDARLAFRAIALAAPAGLGSADAHDVRNAPAGTLRDAMAAARRRDRIAEAYCSGYRDITRAGLPAHATPAGWPAWFATTSVYLAFLSAFPDSHIQRKWGEGTALAVQAEAQALSAAIKPKDDPVPLLLAFDASLKARGINPGTSADLTVATLFAKRLTGILRSGPDNG